MQQTNKYQFKLIDRDDPFGPEALNYNAQKLETALNQHEAAVASAMSGHEAAVENRLTTAFAAQEKRLEGANLVMLGEATAKSQGQDMSLNLSGAGMGGFAALVLLYGGTETFLSMELYLDSTSAGTICNISSNSARANVSGFDVLSPVSDSLLGIHQLLLLQYTPSVGSRTVDAVHNGRFISVALSSVRQLRVSGNYQTGAHIALYGLKK